jgi:hypothetical protein
MPWSTTRTPGTNPKYETVEHRTLRAHYVRLIRAGQALDCTAQVCVLGRVPITNPNGNDPDGLNLGHNDDGVTYAGPQHRACNVKDGARRGNARSRGVSSTRRWVL